MILSQHLHKHSLLLTKSSNYVAGNLRFRGTHGRIEVRRGVVTAIRLDAPPGFALPIVKMDPATMPQALDIVRKPGEQFRFELQTSILRLGPSKLASQFDNCTLRWEMAVCLGASITKFQPEQSTGEELMIDHSALSTKPSPWPSRPISFYVRLE